MAFTGTRVYGPAQPATGAGTTLYTAPAGGAILKEIIMGNTTGTAATITIGIGGVAAANAIGPFARSIQPNDFIIMALATAMTSGETLQASQGTGSAITVTVSAEVIT